MLADIKNDSVTKEQLKSTLDLHEEKSRARHSELENDVTMMKRTLWWVVSTL